MNTLSSHCRAPKRCATMLLSLGAAALAIVALTTGCARPKVCQEGEYPVYSKEGGGICVKQGETPGPEWTEYPPGQTPTYLDEKREMEKTLVPEPTTTQ